MEHFNYALEQAHDYLRSTVVPQAAEIDRNPVALTQALQGLGDLELLTLHGHPFYQFQELVARYSGALAFLQTQHQIAGGMIAESENQAITTEYRPHLATGGRLLGIAVSHLRRSGTPPMQATAVPGGYQLHGHVPWVSGWSCFPEFIVAAILPDGRSVFGILPFVNQHQQDHGGTLAFSKPMMLAAMASTQTVAVDIDQWFLPQEKVVFIKPPNWIETVSRNTVLSHSSFALGCARGGLDWVGRMAKHRQSKAIEQTWEHLDRELEDCRQAIFREIDTESSFSTQLHLRAQAIYLASRCTYAAITVSGGSANIQDHPALRLYQEALVYTVSAQTSDVMAATLRELT